MTKQELYDVLKSDGEKLKAINFVSEEHLAAVYLERFGRNPGEPEEPTHTDHEPEEPNSEKLSDGDDIPEPERKIRMLKFSESGWCEELKRSYFAGIYRPSDLSEYDILRKYASKEL